RALLPWAVAGACAAVAIALGAWLLLRAPARPVVRFVVSPPAGSGAPQWPRVSPDGSTLAFLGTDSTGTMRLWIRRLDEIEPRAIAPMVVGSRPFWSPDSRWLGYIEAGKLKRVPVSGGAPIAVCDVPHGSDGSWGAGGMILFDGGPSGDSIRFVPAGGGPVRAATFLDREHHDPGHAWPFFLPDGRHFLYMTVDPASNGGTMRLGELGSKKFWAFGHSDGRVEFAPPDRIVYPSGSNLMAQRIDVRAGRTVGDPVTVVEGVTGNNAGEFSVSAGGTLAFTARAANSGSQLVWCDRSGRRLGVAGPSGAYQDVALSPDGSRVAVSMPGGDASTLDIWVRDLARGTNSRLTFDASDEIWPVWSPDGTRIAYASSHTGNFKIYVRAANGLGAVDSLPWNGGQQGPMSWSKDGTMASATFTQGWDLYTQPADGSKPPRAIMATPANETRAQLSPDSRWMAYSSDESGRFEVYVVPMSGASGKWQVSASGGTYPRWRADGRELYFISGDQTLEAVPVEVGDTFRAGTPVALFKPRLIRTGLTGYRYDVSADGQRFLINEALNAGAEAPVIVVMNWAQELSKR
ncbi:MAG TPA: hypothetical protein VFK69_11410, partial [Candidatus Eisenbacteria bacterium]|nr:hypothetical protein [Candidatus Eisenbacteria bacterium]